MALARHLTEAVEQEEPRTIRLCSEQGPAVAGGFWAGMGQRWKPAHARPYAVGTAWEQSWARNGGHGRSRPEVRESADKLVPTGLGGQVGRQVQVSRDAAGVSREQGTQRAPLRSGIGLEPCGDGTAT